MQKYKCVKEFLSLNEVAFEKGRTYTIAPCDFCKHGDLYFDSDESGSRHLMPKSLADLHFVGVE